MREEILGLDSRQFEDLIHDILEADNYNVIYHAGVGPDRGRDLVAIMTIDSGLERIERKYLVQCKKWKDNVAEKDVPNIYDKMRQFGCDGYLLVVATDVTTGLYEVINGINEKNAEFCGVWRLRDITRKLFKYTEIMKKYLPDLFNKYFNISGIIENAEVIQLFIEHFYREPNLDEIEIIRNFINQMEIRDLTKIRDVLKSSEIKNEINSTYRKLLNRESDPVGLITWGYWYSILPINDRSSFIDNNIKQSFEYKASHTLIYDCAQIDPPLGQLEFNNVRQQFYNWRTYHREVKDGYLSVKTDSEAIKGPPNQLYFEIASKTNEHEFRLLFLENQNLPSKKMLTIDLQFDIHFQIFLLIIAQDKKPYFIQYIYGEGQDGIEINKNDGYEYIQVYFSDFQENGNWKRFEKNFNEDFKRLKGLNCSTLINVYIGVKGSLRLFRAIIS